MDGPLEVELIVTARMAEAKSPVGVPVKLTVYEPTSTFATVKWAVKVPPEMEQIEPLTGLPDKEQAVSFAEKFVPDTSTVAPTEAEEGLSNTEGATMESVTWSIDSESKWTRVACAVQT